MKESTNERSLELRTEGEGAEKQRGKETKPVNDEDEEDLDSGLEITLHESTMPRSR